MDCFIQELRLNYYEVPFLPFNLLKILSDGHHMINLP